MYEQNGLSSSLTWHTSGVTVSLTVNWTYDACENMKLHDRPLGLLYNHYVSLSGENVHNLLELHGIFDHILHTNIGL